MGGRRLALSSHRASCHGPAHRHVVRALSLGPDRHLPRSHGFHNLGPHLVRLPPLPRRHPHVRQTRHPTRTPPLAPLQLISPSQFPTWLLAPEARVGAPPSARPCSCA